MTEKVKQACQKIESYDVGRSLSQVTSLMRRSLAAILEDSILRQDFEVAAAACEQFLVTQDWNGIAISKRYSDDMAAALRTGAELLLRSNTSLLQVKRFWQKLHSTRSGEAAELTLVELAFLMVLYGELQQAANILAAIRASDKGAGSTGVNLKRASLSGLVAYHQWLMIVQGLESDDEGAFPLEHLVNPVRWRGGQVVQRNRRLMQEYEAEAQRHFKEALRLDPSCTLLRLYSCQLLLASGRLSEADEALAAAEQACPHDADVHSIRALLMELPVSAPEPPERLMQRYQSVLAADPTSQPALQGVMHLASIHPDLTLPAVQSALSALDVHLSSDSGAEYGSLLAFVSDSIMHIARGAYYTATRHPSRHRGQIEGEKTAEETDGEAEGGKVKVEEGEDQQHNTSARSGIRTLMPSWCGLERCRPSQDYQALMSELHSRQYWWEGCILTWLAREERPLYISPTADASHAHFAVKPETAATRQDLDPGRYGGPVGKEEGVAPSISNKTSYPDPADTTPGYNSFNWKIQDDAHLENSACGSRVSTHIGEVNTKGVRCQHMSIVAMYMFGQHHPVMDALKNEAERRIGRLGQGSPLNEELRYRVAEATRLSSWLQKYAIQLWQATKQDGNVLQYTEHGGSFRQLPHSWWRVFPQWRRTVKERDHAPVGYRLPKHTRSRSGMKGNVTFGASGKQGQLDNRGPASTSGRFQADQGAMPQSLHVAKEEDKGIFVSSAVRNRVGDATLGRAGTSFQSEVEDSAWSNPTSMGADADEEEDISMDSQVTYGDAELEDADLSDEGGGVGSMFGVGDFGGWNDERHDGVLVDTRVETDCSSRWGDVEGSDD